MIDFWFGVGFGAIGGGCIAYLYLRYGHVKDVMAASFDDEVWEAY